MGAVSAHMCELSAWTKIRAVLQLPRFYIGHWPVATFFLTYKEIHTGEHPNYLLCGRRRGVHFFYNIESNSWPFT